jgi:hypothetical protein
VPHVNKVIRTNKPRIIKNIKKLKTLFSVDEYLIMIEAMMSVIFVVDK